ncbi:hypothetical protein LTR84_005886 [Exophiala bonariae]|uniref:Zn(2)-C6 fungal-type domain-containing protein n=1 Tax=Exophiala bonariae TaxID=1690606 RepID=A0AAV9N2G3_9EURO|nr:hypothetical protein LTR84_005886 [Exophiala bonariae]
MPRRRPSSSAPVRRRTRTGCLTCRGRKIKCDEGKPVCGQCMLKGFECDTTSTLKWETEYLSKGLAFGRSGVWSKHPKEGVSPPAFFPTDDISYWCSFPRIHTYSFINTTIGVDEEFTTVEQPTSNGELALVSPTNSPATLALAQRRSSTPPMPYSPDSYARVLQLPVLPLSGVFGILPSARDSDASLLLSYYIEKICPLTSASKHAATPFASLIVPFSVSSSPLAMSSITALAACHLSRSQTIFKAKALRLGQQVIQSLRAKLSMSDASMVAMDPEIVVVMLLLCLFEIINECDKRWVVHLKGARDLLRLRREVSTGTLHDSDLIELFRFCEHYFAFQDVMGRTACGENPVFGSEFWSAEPADCNPWLGCSPELVYVLSKITEMGREGPQHRHTLQFRIAVASLEQQLTTLTQRVSEVSDDALREAAEVKKLAAELYLQCVLNDADPSVTWVADRVSNLLNMIATLVEKNVLSGIGWPLFVAAVELDPAHDYQIPQSNLHAPRYARAFVLYTLDKLSGSLVNVARTRSVIEKVWQARDLQQFLENNNNGPGNDWEQLVAPLCSNMSLV